MRMRSVHMTDDDTDRESRQDKTNTTAIVKERPKSWGDVALLAVLMDSSILDTLNVRKYVSSSDTMFIIKQMKEFAYKFKAKTIEFEPFKEWFLVSNAGLKPEKLNIYKLILDKWESFLNEAATSELDPVTQDIIKQYIDSHYTTQLWYNSMKGAEGKAQVDPTQIQDIVNEWAKSVSSFSNTDPHTLDPNEVPSDLTLLTEGSPSAPGLEWRLEELNISAGPLRKGDFVEVAAYVDTGKTTFLSSEVTYMASQLDPGDYVVWINNEQAGGAVRARTYQSTLGLSSYTIDTDKARYVAEYHRRLGMEGRIRIIDDSAATVEGINNYLARVKPKLIVLDMLDKIHGFENVQRDDIRLQKLYQWARELAKKYGPVIATTQVSGDAANIKWIPMELLAGSRYGKQGEADLIITIGRLTDSDDPDDATKRFIYTPKNKLVGGPRSDPTLKNGRWEVTFEGEVGRYRGLK